MGGHKFESSLNYQGRSCLKGEKGTENGREKEEEAEEKNGNGEGKNFAQAWKIPSVDFLSLQCRSEVWIFLRWFRRYNTATKVVDTSGASSSLTVK